ncbi:unnamed protein product [Schistosoma intercalatum]|nr:unnamed protein product [Schistosoma intercalatum]CAH8444708.1 unnamed protein product [Schistosoma intercalatum]
MAELLERFSNSLSKAEQAVKNDCPDKLRDVLKNERTAFTSDLVTEKSFVNHQIRENLLHFAVHQSASRCINLLLNPPFCWNSESPNSLGHTPLDLAMRRRYLPVVYLLASHSDSPYSYKKHPFSVELLLIEPCSIELISGALNANYDSQNSDLAWLFGSCMYGENIRCTAGNIILLFELLLSGPVCPLNTALWLALGRVSLVNSHNISCTSYPNCLFNNDINIWNTSWHDLFIAWASHRSLTGSQSNECDQQHVLSFGPLSLMDFCRVTIRRHVLAVIDVRRQAYKKSNSVKYYNYASLIKKLPIPAKLRAFLSYCDLWPDLDRSQVKVVKGNQFHRNQITNTMINNIFYENIEL